MIKNIKKKKYKKRKEAFYLLETFARKNKQKFVKLI